MTTTYIERTFREGIAQANVEALEAKNRRLQRTIADLLDTQAALEASTVPLPTTEIVRYLEHAQYHVCLDADSAAWLRTVKGKMA